MASNLYGNPHSASASSQLSTKRTADIRLQVLKLFKASPDDFDVVFVANATAGIKLVADAFRGCADGFVYGYHKDSHTSIVGVREEAKASRCLTDDDVEKWLSHSQPFIKGAHRSSNCLFAFPAQSNMNGRRLPLSWLGKLRNTHCVADQKVYTLLDAASFVSTAQLDLSETDTAPDFTVLSFYKIFGFPDLGALIVRKDSGRILQERKYFGGGTVDIVVCMKEQWHASKGMSRHESLEDGSLPIHSIIALEAAIKTHEKLYQSMEKISKHTSFLARKLYKSLSSLYHANGESVCKMHTTSSAFDGSQHMQGPIVAFNLRNSHGAWVSNAEMENLASIRRIHIRTGGVCNPGGVAASLGLEPWEIRRNFSAGYRCGDDNDIVGGKPTGIIRVSLGAMSTISDVERFVAFIQEFYVDSIMPSPIPPPTTIDRKNYNLYVESLTIYPIKSCGGLRISRNMDWEVRKEGLAWDREWCLIHRRTGQALGQKQYPLMALIRPSLDFEAGLLRVRYLGDHPGLGEISVALSADPSYYHPANDSRSRVCGDSIAARIYSNQSINEYFTRILGVPCALARFPAGGSGPSTRHAKAHMQQYQRPKLGTDLDGIHLPGTFPTQLESDCETTTTPILLSNESPILMVNKASLQAVNQLIIRTGGKPASPSVFRANVVVASSNPTERQRPYAEDLWSKLRIGGQEFKMLGSCRRCHMICIDQDTAVKDEEPFLTLANTRRFDGKIFFGSHMCHLPSLSRTKEGQCPTIRVGDCVVIDP